MSSSFTMVLEISTTSSAVPEKKLHFPNMNMKILFYGAEAANPAGILKVRLIIWLSKLTFDFNKIAVQNCYRNTRISFTVIIKSKF